MGFFLAAEGGRQPLGGALRFDTAHQDENFGFQPGSDLIIPEEARISVDLAIEFDEEFDDPARRAASYSIEVDGEARYPTPNEFTALDSGIFGDVKIGSAQQGQVLTLVMKVEGQPEASRVQLTLEGNN